MKLSSLLTQRRALLQQARLANLAFAYDRLDDFARRIARAGLAGKVRLQSAAPEAQRYWPTLAALERNQSLIEEHFNDEDLADLADVLAYVLAQNDLDLTFDLEEIEGRFLAPLRFELTQAGVALDREPPAREHENSLDHSCSDEGA